MGNIFPQRLRKGDGIAIIAPASIVKDEFIDSAAEYIRGKGYEPVVMPHAKGPHTGNYAATMNDRLDDFLTAWTMPEVRAVLCARGGYGAVHLLPEIPEGIIANNPKWLIGFSDISALHSLTLHSGLVSIHGPMAKDWKEDAVSGSEMIFRIMEEGVFPDCVFSCDPETTGAENTAGSASGMLIGGNVAVLNGLAATPFDMFAKTLDTDCILFIEDINEPIYKLERVLYRLYMQGMISRLRGVVVGRFTDYTADRNFRTMEEMVRAFFLRYGRRDMPVAFGFPAGHVTDNRPLLIGGEARLEVSAGEARLVYEKPA